MPTTAAAPHQRARIRPVWMQVGRWAERIRFLSGPLALLGCLVAGVASSAADSPPPAMKPNLVYILADEWRASATGYAGDPNVKTPHLDGLASHSLDFVNAVSVLPVCTPHRAALMTGRFPTSTGMFLNDAHLPDGELCMAEIFASAGYATGYIGKWHLDGAGRTAFIPPGHRQGWQYWKAAECDHDYHHSHYYEGSSDIKRFWIGYDAYAQTSDAQAYIRDHAHDQRPFILVVAFGPPHFPHDQAPKDLQALYQPESIALPANVLPDQQQDARKEAQGYYAHCTALDACVGGLLKTLDETALSASTIVVFSADHGEMLGSHGCPPKMKQACFSEAASVPFLLRYPAMLGAAGRKVSMPITTTDILPTLLGLAGVPIPSTIEGDDLSPILRAGADVEERTALYMNVAPFDFRRPLAEYRALRSSRCTYVRGLQGPLYLFDDHDDPQQLINRVADPAYAPILADLDRRLHEQLVKNHDDFRSAAESIELWGYRIAKHGSIPYDQERKAPEDIQTPTRRR